MKFTTKILGLSLGLITITSHAVAYLEIKFSHVASRDASFKQPEVGTVVADVKVSHFINSAKTPAQGLSLFTHSDDFIQNRGPYTLDVVCRGTGKFIGQTPTLHSFFKLADYAPLFPMPHHVEIKVACLSNASGTLLFAPQISISGDVDME